MIKRICFITALITLALVASGSSQAVGSVDEKKEDTVPAADNDTVALKVNELEPISEDMLIGYKGDDYWDQWSLPKEYGGCFDPVETPETVEINAGDLEEAGDLDIIGYKDLEFFENEEYSHNTVIISVDKEIIDRAGIEALCEKYGLSIMYDYTNFDMYALSSAVELTDDELDKLIEDLTNENGIIMVSKDHICHTLDIGDFGMSIQ